MEYCPCSTLTVDPLSTAAQRVMAALRAQYAGRIGKRPHIAEPFGRAPRPSQKTPEPHTQTKMLNVSSSCHGESVGNLYQPDLVEKHSYYTKPQLQEHRERQLFKHSLEMEFPSKPDLRHLRDGDNTYRQWEADKRDEWRPRDYGDDGNLSGFYSCNYTPGPSKSPPEQEPQRDEFFPRTGFMNKGNSQDVMGMPETHGESSNRKGRIQLLACCEEDCKAEAITHTPPVKRWRCGNLHIPTITCSKQYEEDESGRECEVGETNENPDRKLFWSFEKKTETAEETEDNLDPYGEITEKLELNSVSFGAAVKESSCGETCGNGQNETDACSRSLEYQRYWKEMPTSRRESQKISLVLTDSCHDSATNKVLTNGSHLPGHHTLASLRTSDLNQYTEDEEKASTVETEPAKVEHVRHNADLHMHQSDMKHDQMETQERSIEPELRKVTETHHNQQAFSEVGQSRSAVECVQNVSLPAKQHFSRVKIISDTPKAAQQRLSASEVNEQVTPVRDRDDDKTSETTRCTLALTFDPRVCDASRFSQEERVCVLEEATRARALVVTMVYQDGTTQLDPEQKCPPAVCGVLVLLKKSLDSLVLEETGAAEERLLFLRLEQRPVWAQQEPQHNQDLFTRDVLVKMVCGTQTLVCYKSKDLLRTALKHFSKDLNWKQVAGCQVLDPQIAAWLLDPADSASCFQGLFNKYCTQPTTHTPVQAELRHKTVNHVISSLSQLHRVMVELKNKLETQGLWQLYFCMEQKMIPVLAAMESHRIHVDRDALKKTSDMLGTKMKQLEQEAHQTAGQKFLVSSSSQLRLVLFEKLRLHERCQNKKLPKTMLKQQQSTSEAALLQLQDLHPLPKIVLEYRQVHKVKSTFLDGILSCMTKTSISSTWNQTSTVSGRLSAKHPNFQALPRQPVQISKTQHVEGKEAELVTVHPRTMFIPQEGWTFLSADFCQVELRLLAHLSSDPELLRIFQNPEADVFNMLASQWKGVSEDSVSAEDREHAKRVVYSVVYGAGKERLSGILGVSAEEAGRFQDSFLQKYKEVQRFIQWTVQHCHKYGYVKSIMGRRRSLPHIHSTDWGIRNQAERQAVNFVVQGSAADLCKMAMIHVCSHVASSTTLTARLVAQIHDELLFEVEDSQVEDFTVLVRKIMESLQHISCLGVSLQVPLKVSVSTGRSWGSMCEVNLPHAAAPHASI